MKSILRSGAIPALWVVAILASPLAAAPEYRIVDIGTLGGTSSKAWDINNQGQVVGSAALSTGFNRAFLWTPGSTDGVPSNPQMKNLGIIGSRTNSTAYGVNNAGVVVGEATSASQTPLSFIWTQSTGMLGLGVVGLARKINDAGLVCGRTSTSIGFVKAGVAGATELLDDLSPTGSDAWAINNLGQVVGETPITAIPGIFPYRWTALGGMVSLGTLQAGQPAFAFSINELGAVVGNADITTPTTQTHGFRYTDEDGFLDLGTAPKPAGGFYINSGARDINACGTIVGNVSDDDGNGPFFAAVWDSENGFRDLNTLIPTSAFVANGGMWGRLEYAYAINDAGWIVGVGRIGGVNGTERAFLLQPDLNQDGVPDTMPGDADADAIGDACDNCVLTPNSGQEDADEDNVGDVCDLCTDTDGDGYGNPGFPANTCATDNCPTTANADQTDTDGDSEGDACDPDDDNDGVLDGADNCPLFANADQVNTDGDAEGDACDADDDNDGVLDGADNCPLVANADQGNADGDGTGDACDDCTDTDGDGFGDPGFPANVCGEDGCPADASKSSPGVCGCGVADTDSDSDGTPDCNDACPNDPDKIEPGACGCGVSETDTDGDGTPDCIDLCPTDPTKIEPGACGCNNGATDSDADGLCDAIDNCPNTPNADQANWDGDSLGDVCDDSDGDGLYDATEFDIGCPNVLDPDSDDDGLTDGAEVSLGTDACDPDTDDDGVWDDEDPLPTDPGVTAGFLEDLTRDTAEGILQLSLSLFNGPNNNANKGRRNALANRATQAANCIGVGDYQCAIDQLESLLEKIDGLTPPPDWMDESPEKEALRDEVELLIALLQYGP